MNYEGPSDRQGTETSAAAGGFPVIEAQAGTTQVLPGGAWILRADFVRQGPDLLLVGADGQQILVRDFFRLENPPDLITEGGQFISAQLAAKLAGPLAPGQYAQAAPAGVGEPIGKVVTAEGKVQATRADGTQVLLKEGDPVYQGDVVETGEGAAIGIEFADETTFSLGDSGRMTLDEMIYDPGGDQNSMAVSLVQGTFSFISGQIAKSDTDAMQVSTPVATIGIRGTTVAGTAAAEGSQNSITLLSDSGGQVGEIVISNDGGTQVLNAIGASVSLSSFSTPPPPPTILSPTEIQQQYGNVLASLPPSNAAAPEAGTSQSDLAVEVLENPGPAGMAFGRGKIWLNSQNEGMASSSPPRGRLLAMAGRRVR